MGANLSSIGRLFSNEEVKVNMLGLDATGKSTILLRMKGHRGVTTIPTIGFNVEIVTRQQLDFFIRDFGGSEKIRPLWRCYYGSAQAIIFVVDCGDRERIGEARTELQEHVLAEEHMKDLPVLVFANKQDLASAMNVAEVTERLGMADLKATPWHVQPSCARTGDGLSEGLDWLAQAYRDVKKV